MPLSPLASLALGSQPPLSNTDSPATPGALASVDAFLHTGAPIGPQPSNASSADPYGSALKQLLSAYQNAGQKSDATPTADDRDSALTQFGLNLMRAGGDWRNNFGSAVGQAGVATLSDMDKRRREKLELGLKQDELKGKNLKNIGDLITKDRTFQAGRDDEHFDRGYKRADLALDRDKAASAGKLRAKQGDYYDARTRNAQLNRGSATDRYAADLTSRGMPPGWAQDAAHGNVRETTDQFGHIKLVNRATGEVHSLENSAPTVSSGDPAPMQPAAPGGAPQAASSGNVFNALDQGTGPVSAARSLANSTIGPFISGTPFPKTAEAKADIRNFAQIAKQALVNSDRFPTYEQKLVEKLLPDPDRVWDDPDAERDKLVKLHDFLRNRMTQNRQSLGSGHVTQDEVGRLSNENETIRRVLGLMGSPNSNGGGSAATQALPAGVPQGSKPIGTLNGKPVFKTPDGRSVVAE